MSTTVNIIYNGPVDIVDREGQPIARYFSPDNSYVDMPVFTDGYTNGGSIGDGNSYGKSIYATNVTGWGKLFGLIPMASTTTRFAQFQLAVYAYIAAKEAGTTNAGVTFTIDSYEDEIYWKQMGRNLESDGFTTTLTPVEAGGKGGEG